MAKISIDSNIILFSWIIVARFKVIFEQMLLILDQFVVDLFCCLLLWWQLYHRFYLKSPVLWRIKKGKEKKRKLVKTITGLNKLTNNNIIIIIIRTIIISDASLSIVLGQYLLFRPISKHFICKKYVCIQFSWQKAAPINGFLIIWALQNWTTELQK